MVCGPLGKLLRGVAYFCCHKKSSTSTAETRLPRLPVCTDFAFLNRPWGHCRVLRGFSVRAVGSSLGLSELSPRGRQADNPGFYWSDAFFFFVSSRAFSRKLEDWRRLQVRYFYPGNPCTLPERLFLVTIFCFVSVGPEVPIFMIFQLVIVNVF